MANTSPRIAFCTTCKGRAQHLKITLPRNLADNADYSNCVFVIVDYGSNDDLVEYLLTSHAHDLASGRVVLYRYLQPDATLYNGSFRMAHAKNLAHRCGLLEYADVLVNLDADNFTGEGFARFISNFVQEHSGSFLWGRMIPHVLPRGISGRIVVSKTAFINAGGYDEQFDHWGRDDKNFNERLRRLGYAAIEIPARFLDAVRHNDKMRFREYPHARSGLDSARVNEGDETDVTVANFGNIGCGLVSRVSLSTDAEHVRTATVQTLLVIAPIPTRIFGIGLHKTGTTSLHEALTLLRYDSAHWPNAHWAKAVYNEMLCEERSLTLERRYAATDLPLPLIYKELDRAYPNSKFILTIRPETEWLDSVRRHFDKETNPFRWQWDVDPFSHRAHALLYGRKTFDADVMLARYRRHNAEVIEHFRDRPDSLLVLDMSVDDVQKWRDLLRFLQHPTFEILTLPEFPRANSRAQ